MAIPTKPSTSIAGLADLQAAYMSAHPARYGPEPDPDVLLSNARVIRIENGYLVKIAMTEGEIAKQIFIKDLDELGGVLVAEIVARRIEK